MSTTAPPRSHRWATLGVSLVVLVAPAAVVATSGSAEAKPAKQVKTHNLQVYKKQAYISIDGVTVVDPDDEFDGPATVPNVNRQKFAVACNAGDFAVDGAWTVDKVDDSSADDGSFVAGDESLVAVTESVGRNGMGVNERNIWDFSMTNLAPGRAQITAYVVCLADQTKGGSNPDHALKISDRLDDGTVNVGVTDAYLASQPCAAGQISVANGWSNYLDGFASTPQVRRSWASSAAGVGWQFTFRSTAGTAKVTEFHRCLTLKTGAALNTGAAKPHAHELFASFDPAYVSTGRLIGKSEDAVVTADCNENNAAYVASGFSLEDPSAAGAAFLGVGPRHRTNAWHFAAKANNTKVHVGGTCLQLKTGKQIAP